MQRSPCSRRLVVLACSWLLGCAAEPEESAPPFRFELPVGRATLDNGLELVVVPNHTAPVVTALVAFRAGSSVEDGTNNGASHLFEHMIFQGSAALPEPGAFRERLRALGVEANATTGVDRVTYFFRAARGALDPALELFAGALREPVLDEARLETEREVVLAEFDLNESATDFATNAAGISALFGDYRVHLDPLGSRDVVARITRDAMLALHGKYYVPNNAVLVLSGDVTLEEGEALARRHFGDWARAPDPFEGALPEPEPLERDHFEVVAAPVSFTSIDVWWRGPSFARELEAVQAGQLLSRVTLNPSHMFRSLVQFDLAYSAGLDVSAFRSTGWIHVSVVVRPGNERAVAEALAQVLYDLGDTANVQNQLLETAQSQVFRSFLQGSTEPSSVPHAVGYHWGVRDADAYFHYIDELYALAPRDLGVFERTYLRGRPKVVVLTAAPEVLSGGGIDAAWLEQVIR